MEKNHTSRIGNNFLEFQKELRTKQGSLPQHRLQNNMRPNQSVKETPKAEILVVSSYPPRVCGIATYSSDLIRSIKDKFSSSINVTVCALEPAESDYSYPAEVKYRLDTSLDGEYQKLAAKINNDKAINLVLFQHEFGLFRNQEHSFQHLLSELTKPVVTVFHTILPDPDELLKQKVNQIADACKLIIVMTESSAKILTGSYGISKQKISVIPHGTHLVTHLNNKLLKEKYGFAGRKVLSTFGLLSSGKGIETTLEALPSIVAVIPEVVFLVIGKTHPEVVKDEGEKYRDSLLRRIEELSIQDHVVFINSFLSTPDLLEYLQLTDLYLFTSKNPNQAVSGTFVYAASCACPIISTPIPHAVELLNNDTGVIFDFGNATQLADSVILLLSDEEYRTHLSVNTLQKIVTTAWENSAVSHVKLFEKLSHGKIAIQYNLPVIKLDHLKKMTTNTGIIQFARINQPDITTGYTLDDNARALVAMCMYLQQTDNTEVVEDIWKYFSFIKFCQLPGGRFLNYVDQNLKFTEQNNLVNQDDSFGRAVWALGYMISLSDHLPVAMVDAAEDVFKKSMQNIGEVYSTRAMAFAIKGIYYHNSLADNPESLGLLKILASRLAQMYKHVSSPDWKWFEGYLTYANSILPEAMLYAYLITRDDTYKKIAIESLSFLVSKTFNENGITVISNKKWLHKGTIAGEFGEQPIDVAYTIMTLRKFFQIFHEEHYLILMKSAFNWFLGNNRLNQIVYNPCTGGCYDGMEEHHVNINQGAESTISYLLARLTVDMHYTSDHAKRKLSKRVFYEHNADYCRI